MKLEITRTEFAAKAAAIAQSLGGTFRLNEYDNAGVISGAAPFDINVKDGFRDGRLYFTASLVKELPDGSRIWAKDYTSMVHFLTEWDSLTAGRQPINDRCSADFSRPTDAISKQVRRLIQSVMPHWDRLTQIYSERAEWLRTTEETLKEIKTLLGNLVIENKNNKDGFYVRGVTCCVSAFAGKVQISGLNTLSLSPAGAAKLISLLIEEN